MFDHHDLDNIKLLRITMIMFQVISHQGGKEGMVETVLIIMIDSDFSDFQPGWEGGYDGDGQEPRGALHWGQGAPLTGQQSHLENHLESHPESHLVRSP